MKAVAGVKAVISVLAFSLLLTGPAPVQAWQTAPASVPGAAPVNSAATTAPEDTPNRPVAKPCTQAAIREAAAAKLAPQLMGCNLAVVAPPLLQFFHLVPVTRQVAGKALPGTILDQTPSAGTALSPGGRLSVTVSNGKPAEEPASSSAAPSSAGSDSGTPSVPPRPDTRPPTTSSSSSSATSSAVSASNPAGQTSADAVSLSPTISSEAASVPEAVASAPASSESGADIKAASFPLWGYFAIIVAVLAALAAGLGLLRLRRPVIHQAAVPDIACHLEFGPGRLTTDGPLIDGPAVELAIETEAGPVVSSDITVLDQGHEE